MPKTSSRIESVIGLDVSKDSVTLHDRMSGRTFAIKNQHEALLEALGPLAKCSLAVCEATGGYEDQLLSVLVALGIPVHRADGSKVSAFARSLRSAKTDRIDAEMLALYGAERGETLKRYVPATEHLAELQALVRRRLTLVEARKIERTRAKGPRAGLLKDSCRRAIAFLDAEIDLLDKAIATLFSQNRHLEQRKAVLETIPGIAGATAAKLLALLPELGNASRRQIAALAAVAPHPRESGTIKPKRTTTGGRRILRPILFFAALTATRGKNTLAKTYDKLINAGKPKRLALVAIMRKIVVIANARLAECN